MNSSKSPRETKLRFTFELAYDGGGLGKGGMDTLFVNGQKVVAAHIEQTPGLAFSADEASAALAARGFLARVGCGERREPHRSRKVLG